VVKLDLNRPMADIRAELSRHPVKTRLSLTGTMVVARDIAHAKLQERLDAGQGLPDYIKDHPVYYAGPRPRRRRATPPAPSARPPPGAWTATWRRSTPRAAPW
jgi:fumarate hydratase class I